MATWNKTVCYSEHKCKVEKPNKEDCLKCDLFNNFVTCADFFPEKYGAFDLTFCPDCRTIQNKNKKIGDRCDNNECDCEIICYNRKGSIFNGKGIWDNENW
jgi:hypothetical protein